MVLDINQGSLSVAEYEEFFLSHEIVNQKTISIWYNSLAAD